MSDGDHTIHLFPTQVVDPLSGEARELWHWKRLTSDGAQVDGSGGQRNGLASKKAARDEARKLYPDDKFV